MKNYSEILNTAGKHVYVTFDSSFLSWVTKDETDFWLYYSASPAKQAISEQLIKPKQQFLPHEMEMEKGVKRWLVDISNWNPSPLAFSQAISLLPPDTHSSVTRSSLPFHFSHINTHKFNTFTFLDNTFYRENTENWYKNAWTPYINSNWLRTIYVR